MKPNIADIKTLTADNIYRAIIKALGDSWLDGYFDLNNAVSIREDEGFYAVLFKKLGRGNKWRLEAAIFNRGFKGWQLTDSISIESVEEFESSELVKTLF